MHGCGAAATIIEFQPEQRRGSEVLLVTRRTAPGSRWTARPLVSRPWSRSTHRTSSNGAGWHASMA